MPKSAKPASSEKAAKTPKEAKPKKAASKESTQQQLGSTLWGIANQLRGQMDADDFRDYMLSLLFLRYLSDNYEAAAK